MAEELTHCSAAKLVVYPPETTPPLSQDKAIDPGDHVPAGTTSTSKNPLIVVAPAQVHTKESGKNFLPVYLPLWHQYWHCSGLYIVIQIDH
jgi:hypothetical protein